MPAERSDRILPLLPVYTVTFVGFVGYGLMITVFTPMLAAGLLAMAGRSTQRRG